MGYTNFPGGITSMGIPQVGQGVPATFGNYWFVDAEHGADGNSGSSAGSAFATLERAYAIAATNNDDVICIRGTATGNAVAAMLPVTKSRLHFVGLDGAWRAYGQGARITFAGTTGATNIGVMLNTGVRNSFTNLKFDNESAITQSIYSVVEGGEYAQYTNCEFYLGTNLNTTGAAEFVLNGDSTQMNNCTIGSLANLLVGAIIRPCVLVTAGLAGAGLVCRDGLIKDTRMWRNASATNNAFVYGANATDVQRTLNLEHVAFINNGISGFKPAQCVEFGATLTVGQVILDPLCYSVNATKLSTTTGVFVSGAVPSSGTGIAVNAA